MQTVSDIIRHYSGAGKGGVDVRFGARTEVPALFLDRANYPKQQRMHRDISIVLAESIMANDHITESIQQLDNSDSGGEVYELRLNIFTDQQLEEYVQGCVDVRLQEYAWVEKFRAEAAGWNKALEKDK